MIVLITGASHTGKTTLAEHLLEKYKYPYLSYWLFRDGDEPYWLQKAYIWRWLSTYELFVADCMRND